MGERPVSPTRLMDCQMPIMDGYQAGAGRSAPGKAVDPRIPIVALTADAMNGAQEQCCSKPAWMTT